MNVPASSRRFSRALLPIGLLSFALGCLSLQPKTIPPPAKEKLSAIKTSIAQLRGLEPKRDFEFAASEQSEAPTIAGDSALERAYKQLGMLSASDDLKSALEEYRRLARLIDYDSANDRLHIGADAQRLGSELQPPYQRAASELPYAMAIVHALQEQHFHWQEKINRASNVDSQLAYRAVAGADALLTALAHGSDGNLGSIGHLSAAREVARQMERLAQDLPPFLRNQLTFPLREGSEFVAWAVKAKGTAGLNALYADPPRTTAQILHPERYFFRTQAAQRISPAGLARQLPPPLVDQSLGEFLLRGLLESEHGPAPARQIAAGWRGDRYISFSETTFQTTAWYSAWGSAEEAAAFLNAYRTVADKRQRMRLRRGAGSADETYIDHTRDRGSFALARKGNVVLYLVTSRDRLAALAEEAWNDLAVENDPPPVRFESARGPAQLSLSKR